MLHAAVQANTSNPDASTRTHRAFCGPVTVPRNIHASDILVMDPYATIPIPLHVATPRWDCALPWRDDRGTYTWNQHICASGRSGCDQNVKSCLLKLALPRDASCRIRASAMWMSASAWYALTDDDGPGLASSKREYDRPNTPACNWFRVSLAVYVPCF